MKAIAIVTAAFLSSACFAQHEQFPNVPENHWVYETLAKLSQERVVPHRSIFHSGPPEDRMELAAWTYHGCSAVLRLLERAEQAHEEPGSDGVRVREQIAFLAKLTKETDNLATMAFLFESELKKRHIDAMALRRDMLSVSKRIERIAAPSPVSAPFAATVQRTDLYRQFPYIAENNWAFQTLWNLSKSDIVHLPDEFFRSPRHTALEFARATLEACTEFRYRLARLSSPRNEDATYKQMKVLHKDIANLVKMTDEFAEELKWMHVDPAALNKEMESLSRFVEEGRRNDVLSFPKRLERIANPQGESLPQRITGPDNPLVINSSGAVLQFNTSKRAFDELHVFPVDRYMRLIEVESSEDRYALVLRDKVYNNWKIEIRDRKTGTVAGVVEGDKQVALVCADGEFIIEADAPVTMTGDVKGVTLANVTTNWEIPPGTKKAIELLNAHFKAPFSLHSLDGYLPTRLSPRFGSSQGRILDGGQYAVIARDIKDKASNPRDSAYSLVDMITGHVYANYGSEFQWSSVFVVGRFVFLAPSERGPGTLRVYELNGKLLLAMEYAVVG